MAMQRFFELFRRKNYGAFWNNLFNFFHLHEHFLCIKIFLNKKNFMSSIHVLSALLYLLFYILSFTFKI